MGEVEDIFKYAKGELSVPNDTPRVEPVSYIFSGPADFPKDGTFTLLGKMMEHDTTSGDDLIADYNGYVIEAKYMFEKDWTHKFTNSKNPNYVTFRLQFKKEN